MTRKQWIVLSVAATWAGLAAAAVGCGGSSPTSSSKPIFDAPFMTVYEGCDGTYVGGGTGSGIGQCSILHSQAELNAYWTSLWSDPVPQVDFSQVWVVAVHSHHCGGCCGGTWEVQAVVETPDCISIEIQAVGCTPPCDGDAICACAVLVTVPPEDKQICHENPPYIPCASCFNGPPPHQICPF
jgi:hypothetical protein